MRILSREVSNTLHRTELWTVQPDRIPYPFLVSVTLPAGPRPARGWPAILATDGNGFVGTLHQAATYFGMSPSFAPSVAVSVGYPLDIDPPYLVARNRELTPTPWPEWDAAYGAILQLPCPPTGGADAFLAFLVAELMPMIEAEVGVDPTEWTLVGHSLGGLFTTHALLSDAARFRRYVAFGSSYWWQNPLMFGRAEVFAAEAVPLDIAVWLGAGDFETPARAFLEFGDAVRTPEWVHYLKVMNGTPDIWGDTQRMAAILGRRIGERVTAQVLPNETHGSAALAAMSQGLRWAYKVLPPRGDPA